MPQSLPISGRAEYAYLDVPALVIGAPGDPVHPLSTAHTLTEWLPAARFVEVPRKQLDPHEHHAALQRIL